MAGLSTRLLHAERLTLAVLMSGVVSLALSDFVSPFYWSVVMGLAIVRLLRGPAFALTEMQASLIGWAGFVWVGAELALGRAWVVAFTDFLLILAMAVVIEAATPRNHLHRMLTGLFLVLAAAVLTDSVLYIVPLAAFIWFMWRAAQCLYGMNVTGGDLPLPAWQRDARLMPWIGLLVLALFIVLPRFDFQSQLKPTQPRQATTGFSGQVDLGDFARELNPNVVMRVEPIGMDPESFRKRMMGRYWRGTAMNIFNGRGWKQSSQTDLEHWSRGEAVVLGGAQAMQLALYREASDHPYIMLPDGLIRIDEAPQELRLDAAGGLRFSRAPSRRLRLEMALARSRDQNLSMAPPGRLDSATTRIPASVAAWAAETARPGATPREKVDLLAAEMRLWDYNLNASIDTADPMGSFLRSRSGHCELYASLLALSVRTLGIPARVVNGYYGGDWNETGGFYLIREQHAHSWVEVWLDGRWQTFDSTPPTRWQLSGVRFPELDEMWESVKLSWYRYVLEFEDSDRGELARGVVSWLKQYLGPALASLIALIALGHAGRYLLQRRRAGRQGWPLLDRWLVRHGVRRMAYQPLRTVVPPEDVDGVRWQMFVNGWERQAYGAGRAWSRRELKRRLRAL